MRRSLGSTTGQIPVDSAHVAARRLHRAFFRSTADTTWLSLTPDLESSRHELSEVRRIVADPSVAMRVFAAGAYIFVRVTRTIPEAPGSVTLDGVASFRDDGAFRGTDSVADTGMTIWKASALRKAEKLRVAGNFRTVGLLLSFAEGPGEAVSYHAEWIGLLCLTDTTLAPGCQFHFERPPEVSVEQLVFSNLPCLDQSLRRLVLQESSVDESRSFPDVNAEDEYYSRLFVYGRQVPTGEVGRPIASVYVDNFTGMAARPHDAEPPGARLVEEAAASGIAAYDETGAVLAIDTLGMVLGMDQRSLPLRRQALWSDPASDESTRERGSDTEGEDRGGSEDDEYRTRDV